jgi:RNA polymerase-binding transcription factor DksA
MRRNRGAVRRSEAGRFALSAILLLSVAQAICESTTNRRQNLDDLISSLCIMHSTRSPVWLKGGVMTTRKLDQYRQELRKLAGQVQRDAWAVDEQAQVPAGGQSRAGLSKAPMHLGDAGTDVYLQELNGVLLENERYLFNELLAALRRIDEGTGRCENCGKPIGQERLDALPFVRNCIKCSLESNSGTSTNLNLGRPKMEIETIAAEEKLVERRDLRG